MMIIQALREADTPQEIYRLLTAYVRGTRLIDELKRVPRHLSALPLSDRDDIKARINGLFSELGSASRRLDDECRITIKEALHVFSEGLKRLVWLDRTRGDDLEVRSNPRPGFDQIAGR